VAKYTPNNEWGNCYEFIGSDFSRHDKLFVSETLSEGEYHIFTNVKWPYNEQCSYVISTYAKNEIPVTYADRFEIPLDYLSLILSSFALKKLKNDTNHSAVSSYMSLEDNHTGYGIAHFVNNHKGNVFVSFDYDTENATNITGSCAKEAGKNEVFVEKDSSKLVLFESKIVYHLTPFTLQNLHVRQHVAGGEVDVPTTGDKPVELMNIQMTTSEKVMKFLGRNFELFEKKKLNDDLSLTEFAYKNTFYYVVVNDSDRFNYKVKLNFNTLLNAVCNTPEKTINTWNIDMFEVVKMNPSQEVDFEFTISFKAC